MEQQNNNNKDKNPAGNSGGGRNRNRHRGGRGHGNHKSGERDQEKKVVVSQEAQPKEQKPAQPKEQKPAQPKEQNGGESGNRNRNRHRGGRGRGRSHGEGQAQGTAPQATEQASREPVQDFFVSPAPRRTGGDKWLDDTFAPLHEAEVHDPAAEEAARRLLDAEGPLLFREEPVEEKQEPTETTEVVGIRYKIPGKVYYFAPGELKLKCGTYAIVETARGPEYGEVVIANSFVSTDNIVPPLRPVLRAATEEDARHQEENKQKEQDAFRICLEKIASHGLDMKLVEAQYTFDNSKLLFYFTSDGRVDFRELVKDLAGVFRTRIELRQIGIRDEAKLLGGLGTCGRPLCCAGFLSDFGQVSIKMAKEQNLSLNSTKISGCCGRLMCCLRYEHETYEQEIKLTPAVDSVVETRDGRGTVISNHVIKGTVTVRLEGQEGEAPRTYHRDEVKVIRSRGERQEAHSSDEKASQ